MSPWIFVARHGPATVCREFGRERLRLFVASQVLHAVGSGYLFSLFAFAFFTLLCVGLVRVAYLAAVLDFMFFVLSVAKGALFVGHRDWTERYKKR